MLDSFQLASEVIRDLNEFASGAASDKNVVADDGRRALEQMFDKALALYVSSIQWSGSMGANNALLERQHEVSVQNVLK